ncbi:MAG: Fic family protein [Bacteroidales bacterium]|nr:Fic family protein [Bacteroidales bacterium]
MRPIYIWQQEEWPHFRWDSEVLINQLAEVRNLQGQFTGVLEMLGFDMRNSAALEALTSDITKSSEIEGVILDPHSVRSSIAKHLGLHVDCEGQENHYIDGIVQVMLDATHNANNELTSERLFGWHAALFPSGYNGLYKIAVGKWREGEEPMQVVSGAWGKLKVHYEAPPSSTIDAQMQTFLNWINTNYTTNSVIKAGIAHLWFVTLHPFDDGNGRLTRTITDMMLTRADGLPQRFYSMSAQICRQKKEYYDILEKTQKGDLDITCWLKWFLDTLMAALNHAQDTVYRVIQKSRFWDEYRGIVTNPRQIKIINMLWDGFFGNLTTSKYAKITKCSSDTALNDINYLITKGILIRNPGGGRSASYSLRR